MTQTGYTNAIVDAMLGWLKGFANWGLKLVGLAGTQGASPLLWLSNNWLKLLIFLVTLGLVTDFLVWLIRWRPYWVWLRKKRVIINDENFFAGEKLAEMGVVADDDLFSQAWDDNAPRQKKPAPRRKEPRRDYVVASTTVRRKKPAPKAPETRHSKPIRTPASHSHAKPVKEDSMEDLFLAQGEDDVFNVANLPKSRKRRTDRSKS